MDERAPADRRGPTLLIALVAGALLASCIGSEDSEQPGEEGSPRPPAMGGQVAFVGREGSTDDSLGDIWLMDADGRGLTNLTETPNTYEGDPAWSPDGQRIAFVRVEGRGGDIWLMKADGTEQINLTETPEIAEYSAAWSPDGQRIAFVRKRKGRPSDIWLMSADGSERINLTRSPGIDESSPAWSPDGKRIVFQLVRRRKGDSTTPVGGIYLMNADGSSQRNLTSAPVFDDIHPTSPSFSPDGRRVVFLALRKGRKGLPVVWVMNADGSRPMRLANTRSSGWPPRFLPDGERIGFVRTRGIYVMNADGSNKTRLRGTRRTDCCPAWSPVTSGSP